MLDRFSFLDPWWLFLPEGGSAVLSVAGSGGKTTLLRRLHDHYRSRGQSVLWTQTVEHPAPVGITSVGPEDDEAAQKALEVDGAVHVATDGTAALSPAQIEAIRERLRPSVVLVETHARAGSPLRRDGVAPRWPVQSQLLFLVGSLAAVGRPWNSSTVVGVADEIAADTEPRRIESSDVLDGILLGEPSLLESAPEGPLLMPFFTGFGSFRDMDGMFDIVMQLCAHDRVRAVCLAELLGDERRDSADRASLGEGSPAGDLLSGERIYTVYPAENEE